MKVGIKFLLISGLMAPFVTYANYEMNLHIHNQVTDSVSMIRTFNLCVSDPHPDVWGVPFGNSDYDVAAWTDGSDKGYQCNNADSVYEFSVQLNFTGENLAHVICYARYGVFQTCAVENKGTSYTIASNTVDSYNQALYIFPAY